MRSSFYKSTRTGCILIACFVCLAGMPAWSGVGQSSVITLVFPPGARATGLGEAFTGLSNDINAIFYNPAGLGQDPLANSWKTFLDDKGPFLSIASKRKNELISSELVWAGSANGIRRYSGRMWESHEIYLVEQGDALESIARRFINVDDDNLIREAAWKIRAVNGIEMKRFATISGKLRSRIKDTLGKAEMSIESLARQCIGLPPKERTPAKIYGLLTAATDSLRADTLSDEIAALLANKDTELTDIVELRIPFSIAISDTVTTMVMDESDRLWVGTHNGLWRCSESKWSRTTVVDGLPSNCITAIATGTYGDLAVGTDAGLGIYKDGKWSRFSVAEGLPDSLITSVAFGRSGEIYAGCSKGLIKKVDTVITLFDTSNGLLSLHVNALFVDSKNRLWVGGENGVSAFTGTAWKRYKFPGSVVYCITEQSSGTIWIGTNKGVVTYKEGKAKIGKDGKPIEPIDWKAYHSKNALRGNDVRGLASHGNDVWVVTEQAINKYEWAQKQALLFFEPLLPAFKLRELWHTFGAFVLPTEDWGTLGFSINFINMGVNTWTDELGRELGKARSWEGVFGLSYGLSLSQTFSVGLNMKYAYSALAPGFGEGGAGVGSTYAIDAALLKRDLFIRNLSIGLMLQNMGPPIYYIDPDKSDPIPFTIRLGSAYTPIQTPIHDLTFLVELNREIVKNYYNKQPDPFYKALWTDLLRDKDESWQFEVQQVNVNLGAEYWYSHFMALRTGFLGDYVGERYELTMGLGLNYGNMNFDWSYIHAPEGFLKGILEKINSSKTGASGARHGQYRVSILFKL